MERVVPSLDERIAFVIEAQEEERRRLSREIHDGLGPSLAALGHRLYVIRDSIRSDPMGAESGLDDVIYSLREHVRMTRELINDLRPLDLDQLGCPTGKQRLVKKLRYRLGLQPGETPASQAVIGSRRGWSHTRSAYTWPFSHHRFCPFHQPQFVPGK
ncbi:MAG: hypothetical protein IH921_05420 [Gemmatimonadetes bacterium]|nr:hypothetical protein [Gemmatimonadota bacterium]